MSRPTVVQPESICVIGAACGLGGPRSGPAKGPAALQKSGLVSTLRRTGRDVSWCEHVVPSGGERWPALARHLDTLADTVAATAGFPVVIGGDHSIAIGTWRGVARRLAGAPFGLLWIDAHSDAHVPADSDSGNPHGMPVAALLGEKIDELARTERSVDPSRVVVLGVRSWEAPETARLERLGVRVIDDAELRRDPQAALDEALAIVRGGDGGDGRFGISLDLDVFEPADAPGVTVPELGGLDAQRWLGMLHGVAGDGCVAVELVEYDPDADPDGRTAQLAKDVLETLFAPTDAVLYDWDERFGAHNYAPPPTVLVRGAGSLLYDGAGRGYIDMMAAYSAVSFGHSNPRLVAALAAQAQRLAVTSRAYRNNRLPVFLRRLTELTGYQRALPMNTGAEAVETAIKAARKWGYRVKGIPDGKAEILGCTGNFHGRTITGVALSSEAQYRDGFGPFPPGLLRIPYGDSAALEAAITPNTAAFLVEPVQGEGGIIVPPAGYLAECAAICKRHDVLLIADEVQTGLGRTGRILASMHEGVRPDGVCLGKALGGGLLAVSAFLADDAVMRVFTPGDHGSTFGGNPLAAAVGLEALDLLEDEALPKRAASLGAAMLARLRAIGYSENCRALVKEVRGIGMFAGIEVHSEVATAAEVCAELLVAGVLTKDTHNTVIRLAPALNIPEDLLDQALDRIEATLSRVAARQAAFFAVS